MSNTNGGDSCDPGGSVLRQIGELNEATAQLEELDEDAPMEPEEVGKWITVIGRALAAIFKF